MKTQNPLKLLTKGEIILWISSAATVTASFFLSESGGILNLICSLIGVTALIFVAKGLVLGQILTVIFSLFYGFISFHFAYYGEMITYLGMTAPIAVLAMISWKRNPYRGSSEVRINHKLGRKRIVILIISAAAVTFVFYFILKAFGTANLAFSTISITTSFAASYLTVYRSPLYALAYAANDVVLMVLWSLAFLEDSSCLPMLICFVVFFINDLYGYVNWRRMSRRQQS